MVYRIYVEKKPGFDVEANGLKNELTSLLGIKDLTFLRLLNRNDVEGIDEALFNQCVSTVFSEPPVDNTYAELPAAEGVSGGQSTLQQVDAGRAHQRALTLTDELDALGGRVGALVELAGQVLHGKGHAAVRSGQLRIGIVHRRLAEHSGHALLEQCLVDALHVVAVEQPQAAQLLDAQQRDQLVAQALGLAVEAGFLFNIDTIYHWEIPLVISGEVALRSNDGEGNEAMTERASPVRQSCDTAIIRSFVRALQSLR